MKRILILLDKVEIEKSLGDQLGVYDMTKSWGCLTGCIADAVMMEYPDATVEVHVTSHSSTKAIAEGFSSNPLSWADHYVGVGCQSIINRERNRFDWLIKKGESNVG
jgi:hypothetical protein